MKSTTFILGFYEIFSLSKVEDTCSYPALMDRQEASRGEVEGCKANIDEANRGECNGEEADKD